MYNATIPAEGQTVLHVEISRILDNPYQYRTNYDQTALAELAANIRSLAAQLPDTSGLQSPPLARLVSVSPDGTITPMASTSRYELLDPRIHCQLLFGHRRLRAFRLLEQPTMPLYLVTATDEQMWQSAVTENTQRRDVSPIDEARSLQHAMQEFGLTAEEAGAPFGWSRSTVANKIRLLDLPTTYLEAVSSGVLSETVGRTLLMLAKAPHLLNNDGLMSVEKLADTSRRDLENRIKYTISLLQPIAPKAGAGYTRPTWGDKYEVTKYAPPAFPLDWTPQPADQRVIGPCAGCQFLINFAGDPGPRCAQHVSSPCYDRKHTIWQQHEFDRQRTIITTTPPPAAVGAIHNRTSDPTPAAAPSPAVYTNDDNKPITWFGADYNAPAALIERGLCGQEQCECFVIAYRKDIAGYDGKRLVRPDPEAAPNLCYGCTSTTRLSNRRQKLEHGLDVADKRKAEKQASADTEQRLKGALLTYTPAELWGSTTFLRCVAESAISNSWHARGWPLDKLQIELFLAAAAVDCKKPSQYNNDLDLWKPDLAETWLQSIRTDQAQT